MEMIFYYIIENFYTSCFNINLKFQNSKNTVFPDFTGSKVPGINSLVEHSQSTYIDSRKQQESEIIHLKFWINTDFKDFCINTEIF